VVGTGAVGEKSLKCRWGAIAALSQEYINKYKHLFQLSKSDALMNRGAIALVIAVDL
jgi:hypothetical protein